MDYYEQVGEGRAKWIRRISMHILQEALEERADPLARYVLVRAVELHEENQLPPSITAEEVYNDYLNWWETEP